MEFKDRLTNEELRKKFKSQFELVKYAITLAENMIHTGREPRVKTEVTNRAMQILEEIAMGRDKFDEIIVEPVNATLEAKATEFRERRDFNDRREERPSRNRRPMQDVVTKSSSQKKTRKIFAE